METKPFWQPPRQVWVGGLAGAVVWTLAAILQHYTGLVIDPSVQAALSVIIGAGVSKLVPPAEADIYKHLNDAIVKAAQDDPKVPVTKPPAPPAVG